MRRKKHNSVALERATARAAALTSIDPVLDLGNGLTLESYKAALDGTRERLDAYNAFLSQADEAATRFKQSEQLINDWTDRMLAGVAGRFGRDSLEYEKAGGTRKSERRRPATNKSRKTSQANLSPA